MEQIFLGIIVFNAFLKPSDYQFDTFEVAHMNFKQNKETELNYNSEFQTINALSLGSREYDQATSWLRYGHATYIYGQKSQSIDGERKLKQYGGYVGLFAELNYKQYFGIGTVIGGGATYTEFNDGQLEDQDRSNYFGLASPYITLGLPFTNTASVNLTASTYFLSEPSEQIDGVGEGFETPHNLENKVGLEFVWSWD